MLSFLSLHAHGSSAASLQPTGADGLWVHAAQVDVYSFSMIAYSLFEHCQPFAGMDPVEAARQSALYEKRPQLMKIAGKSPNMQARAPAWWQLLVFKPKDPGGSIPGCGSVYLHMLVQAAAGGCLL